MTNIKKVIETIGLFVVACIGIYLISGLPTSSKGYFSFFIYPVLIAIGFYLYPFSSKATHPGGPVKPGGR